MSPVPPENEQTGPPVDDALARLEATLAGYDLDQALPALETILAEARVTRELLHEDDRAVKLLHEAIVARPLSSLDAVEEVRTEVELLSLEVSVLAERLEDADLDDREVAAVHDRLAEIDERFGQLRSDL